VSASTPRPWCLEFRRSAATTTTPLVSHVLPGSTTWRTQRDPRCPKSSGVSQTCQKAWHSCAWFPSSVPSPARAGGVPHPLLWRTCESRDVYPPAISHPRPLRAQSHVPIHSSVAMAKSVAFKKSHKTLLFSIKYKTPSPIDPISLTPSRLPRLSANRP